MKYIIVLIASVLSIITAWWLIHSEEVNQREVVRDMNKSNGVTRDDKRNPVVSRKLFAIFMCVVNIGMPQFRAWYFDVSWLEMVNLLLLCAIVWPSAWTDYCTFRIPNRFLLVGLLGRCLILGAESLLYPNEIGYILLRSVIAAVALLIVSLICRLVVPNSIGYGDVKLLMVMGFFLEVDGVWGVIFCTMIVAFVVSLMLVITKRANRKTEIPFAPFLLMGIMAASFIVDF